MYTCIYIIVHICVSVHVCMRMRVYVCVQRDG